MWEFCILSYAQATRGVFGPLHKVFNRQAPGSHCNTLLEVTTLISDCPAYSDIKPP